MEGWDATDAIDGTGMHLTGMQEIVEASVEPIHIWEEFSDDVDWREYD